MIAVESALTPRFDPVFSPLGPEQLVLLGGVSDSGFEHKGVIIDTQSGVVTAIEPDSKSKKGFKCQSPSFLQQPGVVVSLVIDAQNEVYQVRYS